MFHRFYRNIGNIEKIIFLSIFMYCVLLTIPIYYFLTGDASDSLALHNGMMFSTKDMDNDRWSSGNCALNTKGAWWFESCHDSNLNGQYLRGSHSLSGVGVEWELWRGGDYSLKKTEMKIRPRSF